MLSVIIWTVHLTVCYYHVTYAFQSESALHSFLNVKESRARKRRDIRSLSDCNSIRTKLAKWLSCVVGTYLYGAFDCMFLSCHIHVQSECTLNSCLNVKKLLVQNRCGIWSLSDCNLKVHLTVIISHTRFRVNLHSIFAWMSMNVPLSFAFRIVICIPFC